MGWLGLTIYWLLLLPTVQVATKQLHCNVLLDDLQLIFFCQRGCHDDDSIIVIIITIIIDINSDKDGDGDRCWTRVGDPCWQPC